MFQTLKFTTTINAPKEIVWSVLFTDENYPKWTTVFCEGSNIKTDWKEGSDAEFTTPNGEGMISKIEQIIPNKLMIFRHLSMMKDGKKILEVEKSKVWKDAKESYQLMESNGKTELYVEMDTIKDYVNYFNETFPKALKRIKKLAEYSK